MEDRWTTIFSKRVPAFSAESSANKPYIETLDELPNDCDDHTSVQYFEGTGEENAEEGDPVESDEEGDVVRTFMRIGHESEVCLPQAEKVVDFCKGCPGASLDALRAGNSIPELSPVALVDEQGHNGSRKASGALNPRELYWRRKRARFKSHSSKISIPTLLRPIGEEVRSDGQKLEIALCGKAGDGEPDAEQQTNFVSNLDPWSINALIGTAPHMEVAHLQKTLYRHLLFEPYIVLDINMEGLPMYHLNFNLPYFALRSSKTPRKDERMYSDKDALRHFYDVSFLNGKKDPDTSSFLYEAQISCTVSGIDDEIWTGYFFIDTYFNPESKGEAVRSYDQDSLAERGTRVDPFTQGHHEVDRNTTTRNPREYFLTVLRFRLQQVTNEWTKVVEMFIKRCRQQELTLLSTSSKHPSIESQKSVIRAKCLSKKLLLAISDTITCIEEFCEEPLIKNFRSVDSRPPLHPIKLNMKELKRLRQKLEEQNDHWTNFTNAVEVGLAMQMMQVAKLSVTVVLCISPVGLGVSIFSMEKEVMPFVPRNFTSLLCTIAVLGALALVALVVQSNWFLHLVSTSNPSKYFFWYRNASLPDFKLLTRHDQLKLGKLLQADEENGPTLPYHRETRSLGTMVLRPNVSNDTHNVRTELSGSAGLHCPGEQSNYSGISKTSPFTPSDSSQ
ncbi:uncharacterized protein A1O9_08555 [Exophiala aquamarina CBS 119918]|uniref:Uncharacterized protein n=1 Tax=Exophiala aquamarina CBS 119918 TaxID=1182545 RepID=A0A072P6T4_9EURO|nr:uncharacterized protein A1O9_08555 [Exophiala aquamarina CBS 119918]KEF55804.1 hypothetical protein A1O9_08555 [Exophiala aquamarina CBS 119918]